MRMHILAVGLVVALSGKAFSQTPTGWQAGIDRFEKRTAAAKAGLLKDTDQVLENIRRTRAEPALVERHLREVKAQKEKFQQSGDLPTHDDLLGPVFTYLNNLQAARVELNRAYKEETDEARRQRDDRRLTLLVKEKAAFDAKVAKGEQFATKSTWKGSRYFRTGSSDVHVNLGKAEDGTLRGTFWQDTDTTKKFGLGVEGVIDGHAVRFKTAKVLDGKKRIYNFSGYVFQNRMILQVSGVEPSGKPAGGIINFYKK